MVMEMNLLSLNSEGAFLTMMHNLIPHERKLIHNFISPLNPFLLMVKEWSHQLLSHKKAFRLSAVFPIITGKAK